MKLSNRLLLIPVLLISLASLAVAQSSGSVTIFNPGSDYCQNPSVAKTSAVVNIASATTTELVAASAGKKVYLCKFSASVSGTTPTLLFKTGTKVSTACDTGPASISGTYAITSGTLFDLSSTSGVTLQSATAGELCITSGGTGPSVQGVVVYVQR